MITAKIIKDFLKNKSGQISVATCLSAFPILGAVGLSVDYSSIAASKADLQKVADTEALERRNGRWLDSSVYQVDKTRKYNTYFMGIMGYNTVDISVTAQARYKAPTRSFNPATVIPLSGNANDYTMAGFYCYNADTNQRHSFTDMSDNRGNTFQAGKTTCGPGETIEFYMKNYGYYENIKFMQNGQEVDAFYRPPINGPCVTDSKGVCELYYYMTDKGNKSNFHYSSGASSYIADADMESVVCDVLSQCLRPYCYSTDMYMCLNYESMGGRIPQGTHRSPKKEEQNCSAGKYLYYGFEDTPATKKTVAGQAVNFNGDADYNDYGVIISCPESNTEGGKNVFLIK